MLFTGIFISITGIVFIFISSIKILPKTLFMSEKELEELSNLPFNASNTNVGEKNEAIITSDIEKLEKYREHYLNNRRTGRKNGKTALKLLVVGFILQTIGLIITALS